MTADEMAQVIYAKLIEQNVVENWNGESETVKDINGYVNLLKIAEAILKTQNDEAAMARVADPVPSAEFDKAVESSGLV